MLYFRVKTGYGKDDFISITEKELPSAIRAQITGKVALFSEGSISGNHIMMITPDYNRAMGYNRDYQLTGEDYAYIGKERMDAHRDALENAKIAANTQLGRGNDIKLLQ